MHVWFERRHSAHRPRRALHLLLSGAAALTLLIAALSFPAAAQSIFVPGFEDLPLMPELVADTEAPVVFDAPGGRIVQAQAHGRTSAARVVAFYGETLPQMGWRATGADGAYEREGESLKLLVSEPEPGEVAVRFSLAPMPR